MVTFRSSAPAALLLAAFCTWALPSPSTAADTTPRYQVFTPPQAVSAQANSGEMNLGFNPLTKRYLAMAFINGKVYRVTPPEVMTPALPESCDAKWEEKTPLATSQPQAVGDPILYTDAASGRSWASNFTAGANYSYAYTSDDGESWTNAGVSPPNGGADHQTIASGPYPAGSPFKQVATANGFPNAVYFCSQALVPNFCQRSDDGGRSYGSGTPFTNGLACGGLHGHARVSPDGDVQVPDKSCGGGLPGYSVSSDAGLTWKDITIPGMTTGTEDPSIGVASNGTLYFCNVNANGHVVVAVSKNKGSTWSTPFDIGAAVGINNAVFTNAIAGDPDRAACAFVGTTTPGNFGSIDFTGVWYPFIAHTYDGGATWTTINISPNDPVQGVGGVCRSGTTCMSTPDNRNLLDFNEITIDHNGRPAYGYDDGCTGACVTAPTVAPATRGAFGAQIKIARQSGGRTLFKAKDASNPDLGPPKPACLAGTRTIVQSALSWNAPDTGGKPIAGYSIFRSTKAGVFGSQPIAVTDNPGTTFSDFTQDPDVPTYYYKIVARNELGEGLGSNELPLPLSQPESICVSPGLTQLTDPADDIFSGITPSQSNEPFYDLRSLSVSQPYFANGDYKIAFNLRVTSLATVPANAFWPVNFCSPAFTNCTDTNAAISATNKFYTVRMSTMGGTTTPFFELLAPNAADTTRAITALPAAGGSKFAANGLITIVVNAAAIGLTPAGASTQTLTRFLSRVAAGVAPGVTAGGMTPNGTVTPDNMPNSLVGEGTFKTAALNFCGPNTAPAAILTATPSSGSAPLLVAFSGSGSTDSDAGDTIASYTFDFGDGSDTVTQTGARINHNYAANGSYNATLKVRDSRGAASTIPAVVRIIASGGNTAPVAQLVANPTSGAAPLLVRFDASASSDPDIGDSVASFSFDLDGDGSFEQADRSDGEPSFTYQTPGTYVAKVKVKDRLGLESPVKTLTITVTPPAVTNTAPTAQLTSDKTSGVTPLTVAFDASGSSDADRGDMVVSYSYDLDGDGSFEITDSTDAKPSFTYSKAGIYTAKVTVKDKSGNVSTAASRTISVNDAQMMTSGNRPPVAALNAPVSSMAAQSAVRFDGISSYDPDGNDGIASLRFDFGDNTPAVTVVAGIVEHRYAAAGSYIVTLIVTDTRGANSAPITQKVTITPAVVTQIGDVATGAAVISPSQSRSGGAVSPALLAALGLLALQRRRRTGLVMQGKQNYKD